MKRKEKEKKREGRANKREREEPDREGEREKGEREKKGDFPGILIVESRRFESKSRSTHRGLHVGTKILEFRQTP